VDSTCNLFERSLTLLSELGPYIAVLKTHCDIVSDFSEKTIKGLKSLSEKHNFVIFEDRKFVDIGNTVQMQYHGGALRILDWAHVVNASILAGEGIIQALAEVGVSEDFVYKGDRAVIILADMTSRGTLATGKYTSMSVDLARKYKDFVIGFVATHSLSTTPAESSPAPDEDFVIFTTGVNRSSKGDALGQTYQTPTSAVEGGADFLISGRGIYAAKDPVESVKLYRQEGWEAYLKRVEGAAD
jgi:orotidine-5'-phosphate decarboxylase